MTTETGRMSAAQPNLSRLPERAVVLHSGGQDSTTCLAWAIDKWGKDNVLPVVIDYEQRHHVEIECARRICRLWELPFTELHLGVLRELGGAALTDDTVDVSADATNTGNTYAETHDLPSTFVPGRNLLFFTVAAAFGARHGIYNIVTGVCETDRAGYPDCRFEFVEAAETALRAALDEQAVTIYAPLIARTKAETFMLADQLGVLDTIIEQTSTCYHGFRGVLHPWGYGCGDCPACEQRALGWNGYQLVLSRG